MDPTNQNSPIPETPQVLPTITPPEVQPLAETPVTPTNPVPDQVTVIAAPETISSNPISPEAVKKSPKIIGILLGLIIFLLFGSFGIAYAIATEKISAPNQQIKQAISTAVFSIPFIPKTPGFIVDSFLLNTKPESKGTFDLSIAASSNDFQAMIGGSNFDIRVSGYSDFSDPKKPLADVKLEVSNLLDGQFKKTADKIYVKIGKIPAFVYMFMSGMTPEIIEPLFADWISSDVSTLDTDARELLGTTTASQSPIDEATLNIFRDIFTKDVRPYLKLSQDNLDGEKVYKLEFSPTAQQLDTLFDHLTQEGRKMSGITTESDVVETTKPSDSLKDVRFSAWIDTKNHMRRITANGTFDYQQISSTGSVINPGIPSISSPIAVAIVLNQSNFGQAIPVVAPDTSITSEEFFSRISAAMMSARSATDSSYYPLVMPEASLTY